MKELNFRIVRLQWWRPSSCLCPVFQVLKEYLILGNGVQRTSSMASFLFAHLIHDRISFLFIKDGDPSLAMLVDVLLLGVVLLWESFLSMLSMLWARMNSIISLLHHYLFLLLTLISNAPWNLILVNRSLTSWNISVPSRDHSSIVMISRNWRIIEALCVGWIEISSHHILESLLFIFLVIWILLSLWLILLLSQKKNWLWKHLFIRLALSGRCTVFILIHINNFIFRWLLLDKKFLLWNVRGLSSLNFCVLTVIARVMIYIRGVLSWGRRPHFLWKLDPSLSARFLAWQYSWNDCLILTWRVGVICSMVALRFFSTWNTARLKKFFFVFWNVLSLCDHIYHGKISFIVAALIFII